MALQFPPNTVTVTSTAAIVLPANRQRRAMFLKCPAGSAATVFVKFDNSAQALTAANGYPLAPGDSLFVPSTFTPDGVSNPAAVQAITAAANSTLAIVEL
jgi:hypothetical protein